MLKKLFFFILYLFLVNTGFTQNQFAEKLFFAAKELTNQNAIYDPSYFSIAYPNGDIPLGKGVCTDLVIRAFRKNGIDLQKEVHEDMLRYFDSYPNNWGLKSTGKNIDHRRVPNLMTFFSRNATTKIISKIASDYQAGDIVCWDLGAGITHIGILVDEKSSDGYRNLVVHNIGNGQEMVDCLFYRSLLLVKASNNDL